MNKLFTIVALALLPLSAQAGTLGLPVTVDILNPSATINALPPQNKRLRPGLTLHGQSGQVIRYVVGVKSGTVILDFDGFGSINLPKDTAINAEYMFDYD